MDDGLIGKLKAGLSAANSDQGAFFALALDPSCPTLLVGKQEISAEKLKSKVKNLEPKVVVTKICVGTVRMISGKLHFFPDLERSVGVFDVRTIRAGLKKISQDDGIKRLKGAVIVMGGALDESVQAIRSAGAEESAGEALKALCGALDLLEKAKENGENIRARMLDVENMTLTALKEAAQKDGFLGEQTDLLWELFKLSRLESGHIHPPKSALKLMETWIEEIGQRTEVEPVLYPQAALERLERLHEDLALFPAENERVVALQKALAAMQLRLTEQESSSLSSIRLEYEPLVWDEQYQLGRLQPPKDQPHLSSPGMKAEIRKGSRVFQDDGLTELTLTLSETKPCLSWAVSEDVVYVNIYVKDGKTVNLEGGQRGYVRAKNVRLRSSHTPKEDQPLFTGPPVPGDVHQGRVGDCYLMSALSSLAHADPDAILQAIRDNDDGTVTVRFFGSSGDGERTERYIRVQKSTYSRSGVLVQERARGSLWVQMIEKAYAIFRDGSGPEERKQEEPELSFGSYMHISGGHASEALEALTGRPSTVSRVDKKTLIQPVPKDILLEGVFAVEQFLTMANGDRLQAQALQTFFETLGFSLPDRLDQVEALFAATPQRISVSFDVLKRNTEESISARRGRVESSEFVLDGLVMHLRSLRAHSAELEPLSGTHEVDISAFCKAYLARLREERMLPGALGSGIYTDAQLELARTIQEALRSNKSVCASSMETLPGRPDDRGHSDGETMVMGLVARHSYAVIGLRPDVDLSQWTAHHQGLVQAGEWTPEQAIYVQVRNPWGELPMVLQAKAMLKGKRLASGRGYKVEDDHLVPKKKVKDTFWLELTDFTSNFRSVDIN